MVGAIICLSLGFQNKGLLRYFFGAGLCTGLSFLMKGPVAFWGILLPFLIAYYAVFRPPLQSLKKECTAIFVCLIASMAESQARLERHIEPWYFYSYGLDLPFYF